MPRGHVAIDPAGQRRLLLSPEWMEEGRLGSQANAVLGDKRRSARSNLGAGRAGPSREIFLRTKKRDAARSARRRRAGGLRPGAEGAGAGGGSRSGALPVTGCQRLPVTSSGAVGTLPVTVSGCYAVRTSTHAATLSPGARGAALECAEAGTAVPTPAPRCETQPWPCPQTRTHAGPSQAPGLPRSLRRKAR